MKLTADELAALRAAERVKVERRARDAYDRALRFETSGILDEALRWMERAHRLAPTDDAVTFSLATLRLRRGDAPGAAILLQPLVRRLDMREAIISLALARRQQRLMAEAAHLLDDVLARHVLDDADPSFPPIATAIARESGAAGWCGVDGEGRLRVRLLDPRIALTLRIDDAPATPLRGHGVELQAELGAHRQTAARAHVTASLAGRPCRLLGAALDLATQRQLDGCVAADDAGGLVGWASHRRDPARVPALNLADADGRPLSAIPLASGLAPIVPDRPFGLAPYGFRIPAAQLPQGPVRILDEAGRDLRGSPIDPGLEVLATAALAGLALGVAPAARIAFVPVPAAFVGPPSRPRRARRRPGIAIVVPVYGDAARTLACLDSLAATVPAAIEIHVVDDATPESSLAASLEARAHEGKIVLHRWADGRNRGFPAAANAGIEAVPGRDVVLLNSDTLVAGDWLARLTAAAYAAPDTASATPLTNEGSIVGYPRPRHPNDMPGPAETARLDALAAGANPGLTVELPTGNGFCMFLRREAITAVGLFREDLFAQGYGEENDWCLRARHAGFRHVAALDVFVAHAGGSSFRAGRNHLLIRNLAVLNRLHPGYDALIARHIEADPMAPARRRLDIARLLAEPPRPAVLLVTHQMGGGVERVIRERVRAHVAAGRATFVLRGDPEMQRDDVLSVEDGARPKLFPNLRWTVPDGLAEVEQLLRALGVERVEIHHLLGHHEDVEELCRALGAPIDILVHDYAWFCPRIALIGTGGVWCGEPDIAGCRSCIDTLGSLLTDDRDVDALVASSADLLGRAARVIAPTADAAARLERHFPGLAVAVEPWEAPIPLAPAGTRRRRPRQAPVVVCVLGAIGEAKGIEVLIACARDAAARALPLRFVVVGHTSDDERVLAAGPVFITGPYQEDEVATLVQLHGCDIAFMPALWPETWSYALSECWRAGLDVVAFELGAQAERIRARRAGRLLPLGLPPHLINDALINDAHSNDAHSNEAGLGEAAAPVASIVTNDLATHRSA